MDTKVDKAPAETQETAALLMFAANEPEPSSLHRARLSLVVDRVWQEARNDIANVVTEAEEFRQLFQMQWDRMAEATDRWRAEDPQARALIMPDLGALLRWLMDVADKQQDAAAGVCGAVANVMRQCRAESAEAEEVAARCYRAALDAAGLGQKRTAGEEHDGTT